MTKKDYKLIAEAVRITREFFEATPAVQPYDLLSLLVEALSSRLKADNEAFDEKRFSEATQINTTSYENNRA